MEKTITISDDVYEELIKIKKNKGFSEALREMMDGKGNLNVLLIGFGTRDAREKKMLMTDLKKVEGEFQKWF